MAEHADTRRAHSRIAAELRAKIMSGDLAPGGLLPSTATMVERFGASNATVQQAIDTLRAEGFIYTRAGARGQIRQRRTAVVDVGPYLEPSAAAGVTYEILAVEQTSPPAEVAAVFNEQQAVLRKRLLVQDGEPAELNWAWYPASIAGATRLAQKAKLRGGAPRALADLGFPQRRMVDQVSARLPTSEEFVALRLTDGIPVLRQFRVIYSDGDRPVEVAVMVKAGHLFELRYPPIPL